MSLPIREGSLSLEECETLTDFEEVGPHAGGSRGPPTLHAAKGRSSMDSVWHVQEPPVVIQEPSPPAETLTPLQPLRVERERDTEAQIEAQIVSEFQRSTFLRLLTQRMRTLQDEVKRELQDEVAQLRTENGRLRAQFAKNGMELPGSMTSPAPAPLAEKRMDQVEMILSEDTKTSDSKTLEPRSSLKSKVTLEPRVSVKEVQDLSNAQEQSGQGPTMVLQLKRLSATHAIDTQERNREIKNLVRRASTWYKPGNKSWGGARNGNAHSGDSKKRNESEDFSEKMDNRIVGKAPVFADSETMKEQVRRACIRPPYHVSQYYKHQGWAAALAKNIWFEYLTFFVILVNAIWIAIDTDLNKNQAITDADPIFQIAEYFFIIYFMVEWVIRYSAFAVKWDCMRDTWFVFDSFLVILMLIDTGAIISSLYLTSNKTRPGDASVLKLFRMLRITRTARMARLLKALPELTILVKGIIVAARSVFFTLVLLTLIIYVFAVAFTQITEDTQVGHYYFRSVGYSMKALLVYATLPDMAGFVDELGEEHVVLAICLLLFILLASLTVMNMLVGVLVEVVSVVSAVEKEELLVTFVKKKLLDMLRRSGLDADEDMMISRYEFEMLLVLPQAAKVIQDVGVDPVGLVDFADYIFQDSHDDKLSFSEFIDLVLELRGCKHSTVKDVVDLRKMLMKQMEYIERALASQDKKLEEIVESGDEELRIRDTARESQNRSLSVARAIAAMKQKSSMMSAVSEGTEKEDQPVGMTTVSNFHGITPAPPANPCPKVHIA